MAKARVLGQLLDYLEQGTASACAPVLHEVTKLLKVYLARAVVVEGADHFFHGAQRAIIDAIGAVLA